MELSGKHIAVVGLGESGLAVVRFLCARGAQVTANDQRDEASLGEVADEIRGLGASVVAGGHPPRAFQTADLIVVSPGVPDLDVLRDAVARGVPVISEIELACRFIDAPIVAVTGTNGKSTVTTLIGQMCERLDRPVFVGGNLGRAMVEVVDTPAASSGGLVIVELSSFQLERVVEFRAHVGVLLNVTADHLDRYASFEAYAAAKGRVFERQTGDDFAVLPADQPDLRQLVAGGGAVMCFDGATGDVRVVDRNITDVQTTLRIPLGEIRLQGLHNVSNACAATLVARLVGVPSEDIAHVLRAFGGLAHRMQSVGVVDGVRYIDDSKATNVGAAVASIDGLAGTPGKVVLIAGGVDKGGSYAPLRERMDARGRAVVVIGEAARLLQQAFTDSSLQVKQAASMGDAVDSAAALAQTGDTVLLAPACSSFDMFRSYAERGDRFQDAVRALEGAA